MRIIFFLLSLTSAWAAPRFARNFSVESSGDTAHLRIYSGGDTANYAIHVPLRRVICLAGIHLGFLEALDLRDRLVGVDRSAFVSDSALRALGKLGRWREVGSESNLDWERAASLRPDAIFISGIPAGDARVSAKAKTLGIPVLVSTEWLENHPLGRAEWISVYGALFGREKEAKMIFASVTHAYDSLRTLVLLRKAPHLSAFGGAPWHGAWHVAGGGSYLAQLLRDAGIRYLWDDDKHTGALTLDLEAVLSRAQEADLWLSPGSARNLSELAELEPRSKSFRAFGSRRVYQNDVRCNPDGGNDYWESGPTRPDLILNDLIRIVDGGLDKKSGSYFRRLPSLPSPPDPLSMPKRMERGKE